MKRKIIPYFCLTGGLTALAVVDIFSGIRDITAFNVFGYMGLIVSSAAIAGLLVSPLLIVGKKVRFAYVGLVLLWGGFCSLEWYLRLRLGVVEPGGGWVDVVMASSFEEVKKFLACELSWVGVALTILVVGTVCVACWLILRAEFCLKNSAARCLGGGG